LFAGGGGGGGEGGGKGGKGEGGGTGGKEGEEGSRTNERTILNERLNGEPVAREGTKACTTKAG